MISDNLGGQTYAEIMAGEPAHIVLKLDTESPIEIGDFVQAFISLASQYNKFIADQRPDVKADARVYVREVRAGCIEADLIPQIFSGLISFMDQIIIVETFVRIYGGRLRNYFNNGGRDKTATKSDLKDLMGQVAAIANDPNGKSTLQAVNFEDGEKKIRASVTFNTIEAQAARREIENHRLELENKSAADYTRVLMRFKRSDIGDAEIGKRSGERVIIEQISPKDRPLIYASSLTEEKIKYEIRHEMDNVFKKGFVVDVNVETQSGKPVAYRLTHLHQIFDLPDDGG